MDITDFMTWFLSQVVSIFTKVFTIMDNIQFMGTSLLKVCITLVVLVPLLTVVLTISKSYSVMSQRAERYIEKEERAKK